MKMSTVWLIEQSKADFMAENAFLIGEGMADSYCGGNKFLLSIIGKRRKNVEICIIWR